MEPREYDRTASAEEGHWWFRALRTVLADLIEQGSRESPIGGPALDAGCGTGGNLRHLLADRAAVGIDRSPLALAHAESRTSAPLARGSIGELPFRDRSFGLVLCADVLYHREVKDDIAALREFRRVLQPGGWLVVNVPAYNSLRSAHDRAMHTARRYRRKSLSDRLRRAGLRPERIVSWNGLLLGPALLMRFLRRTSGDESDITALPAAVNQFLFGCARIDTFLARHRLLPFGLSVAGLAQRDDR